MTDRLPPSIVASSPARTTSCLPFAVTATWPRTTWIDVAASVAVIANRAFCASIRVPAAVITFGMSASSATTRPLPSAIWSPTATCVR